MYSVLIGILFCFLYLVFATDVWAASVTIGTGSATLTSTQEYTVPVTLSITAPNGSQYYLRGTFAKEGSTNYCGYTWNDMKWFNGPYSTNDGWKNFLQVTITDNSWSGDVKSKIDFDDSGCTDSGTYIFKIERFTISGSGTFDNQNGQTIQVTLPTPTPTFSPTPKSQSSPSTIPTPTMIPTKSLQTSVPSLSMTRASSDYEVDVTNVITPSFIPELSGTISSILGDDIVASESPTTMPRTKVTKITKVKGASMRDFPIFLALGGMILLVSCGIVFFQIVIKRIKNYE